MSQSIRNAAVIGLGFVGLPLALSIAAKGYKVLGIDIDSKKIDALQAGRSYLRDVPEEQLKDLTDRGLFQATFHFEGVRDADAIIVCVPTPLKNHEPDLSYILSSVEFMKPHLRQGQLLILESSTYPGTTEQFIAPILEEKGFRIGADFYLGYSPERIDPGNTSVQLLEIPKVVSGMTANCLAKVRELYDVVFRHTVPVSSPRVAEFVKIFENSQRMINISFVNEISLLAQKLGIDIWEAIEAAKTKPMGFHAYYPSAGIGGHCIPVDPYYLTWTGMQAGVPLSMIYQAGLVNERMPHHVVNRLAEALQEHGSKAVGVIGLTYKKDVNDIRESAALKVVELLKQRRHRVFVHDDVYDGPLPDGTERFDLEPDALRSMDAVLILVDHSGIDWQQVKDHARLIVDTRNVIRGAATNRLIKL